MLVTHRDQELSALRCWGEISYYMEFKAYCVKSKRGTSTMILHQSVAFRLTYFIIVPSSNQELPSHIGSRLCGGRVKSSFPRKLPA